LAHRANATTRDKVTGTMYQNIRPNREKHLLAKKDQSKTVSARIPIPFAIPSFLIRFLIYQIKRIEGDVFYEG
jgi:hypothetical protein